MNKGNFTAQDNFPQSTYTLDFLQQMSQLAGKLAMLGGANYILSGCVVADNNVSSGLVVINGEILPFDGGSLKSKITIQETKVPDHYAGVNYPEAYLLRRAVFSDAGEYNWADFAQVLTNKELEKRIDSLRGENPGFVKMWSGRLDRLPDSFILCDGRLVRTDEYPELATYYGKEYEESFNLPDLRGLFIVGYDSNNESYNSIGKTGGKDKVVLTADELPEHRHPYTDDTNAQGKYPQVEPGFPTSITGIANVKSSAESSGWGTVYESGKVGANLAHENRPPFYTLAYVIRVKY